MDPSFAAQLHDFVGTCQVLCASASARERSLTDIAAELGAALPPTRSSADFLLLRSIVGEFATRAVERANPRRLNSLLPLLQLRPGEKPIDEVFLRCMSDAAGEPPVVRSAAARSIDALRTEQALSTIAARCGEPELDAAAVALAIQVSERSLSKLLRRHEGFHAVLRQARVTAARRLLEHSLCSIKEIAAHVGYTWTSQLDRDFQRECGMTPGQYRLECGRARQGDAPALSTA